MYANTQKFIEFQLTVNVAALVVNVVIAINDYNHIVTELLEDIDVVTKPNKTASDSDQSYDKPQSPTSSKNHLDEIDVLVNPEDKNHEKIDVLMEPGEIDISNNVETNVLEKHEEMDIPKKWASQGILQKLMYRKNMKKWISQRILRKLMYLGSLNKLMYRRSLKTLRS
ncbi:hypothetical protein CTI12_AA503710 [Artemisia annua]|uniref:Uncharacterized protein n=1 Tax=Artemisia annua TaxID=35608 RepID=A0A2U1LD91_ARTAN|nr:hypothetical protein CTI12_AA503710 [Artemisia annua]